MVRSLNVAAANPGGNGPSAEMDPQVTSKSLPECPEWLEIVLCFFSSPIEHNVVKDEHPLGAVFLYLIETFLS